MSSMQTTGICTTNINFYSEIWTNLISAHTLNLEKWIGRGIMDFALLDALQNDYKREGFAYEVDYNIEKEKYKKFKFITNI